MRKSLGIGVAALLTLTGMLPVHAQETKNEKVLGWTHGAEFSYVLTTGNSETSTLGLKDKSVRTWDHSSLEIDAEAVRANSTTTDPIAVDIDGDGVVDLVDPQKNTQTTAERYLFQGRYDHKIQERFFWFAGAGWDRNQPAGIQNRYAGFGGVGNIWRDDDVVKFRTDYALTYTHQEDVVPDPAVSDNFAGLRVSYAYLHKFGTTTTFEETLVLDENLDETSDFRADFYNAVTVAMSEKFALKVGYRMLYDNQPSIGSIPVVSTDPAAPASYPDQKDDLDTIFTTSLLLKF